VAVVDRRHGPDAVPLDLEAELLLPRRELAAAGEHRDQLLGQRLVRRVLRRVHPVDHPVRLARAEQRVAAGHALAVEGGDHLVLAELLGLVGAAVPDGHRPGAVLALRDLAVELEVLERVVLRSHRQPVLGRVLGHAARQRPRRQRALVLETQIPVEAARAVLLDDEARGVLRPAPLALRLRALLEVALRLVGAEPVGHGS
jgi:hypothetical protein